MEIKLIRNFEELKLYRNEWQNILENNNNDNPFIEFDWIEKWWELFKKRHELFTIVIKHGHQIIGFCPLMITKKVLYYEVNFIGYPESTYIGFIIQNKYKMTAIQYLMNYLLKLDGNFVFNIHGYLEEENFSIIKEYLNKEHIRYSIRNIECRIIKTDEIDFEDYYQSRRKHSSIRNIKRKEKKLNRLGNLVYKKIHDERIDEIFMLHEKRWKKRNDTSNFSKGETKEFFKQLPIHNNLSFKVKIDGLYFNDKLIAFQYGFLSNSRYILYRTTPNEDFSKYGPGKILLKETIKECFNHNIKVFDLGGGYERYKAEWTDDQVYINRMIFPAGSFLSKIIFYKYYFKEKMIKLLKKNKRIVYFKRNTLGKVKYFFSKDHFLSIFNIIINGK